jgi:release factor glutamine methyltransferase
VTVLWRALRADGVRRLREAGVEDAPRELAWIIEQATGRTTAEQVAALDAPATEREQRAFHSMVERRAGGEPLQYVLGRWGFRTLDLLVDRRVLIPRPETEVVGRRGIAVDLGTGSGAIALSIAAERWPDVEVWATDASDDALAVARANLAGLGRRASVVRLVGGDWCAALPGELRGRVDMLVSNPPYVAASDFLPAAVADWEPHEALVPGPTGLEAIERIVAEAAGWLTPHGVLVLETGETQGERSVELARAAGFARAEVHPDLTGRHRALIAHRG